VNVYTVIYDLRLNTFLYGADRTRLVPLPLGGVDSTWPLAYCSPHPRRLARHVCHFVSDIRSVNAPLSPIKYEKHSVELLTRYLHSTYYIQATKVLFHSRNRKSIHEQHSYSLYSSSLVVPHVSPTIRPYSRWRPPTTTEVVWRYIGFIVMGLGLSGPRHDHITFFYTWSGYVEVSLFNFAVWFICLYFIILYFSSFILLKFRGCCDFWIIQQGTSN